MNSIKKIWNEIAGLFRKEKKGANPKNGKWKEFNKHAILVSEGFYQHDLKHGDWRQYYESGELLIEETYERGVLHGRYACYHTNGVLLSEGQYRHGRREGYFNVFDESGKPVKRLLFVNNVMVEEVDATRLSPGKRMAV